MNNPEPQHKEGMQAQRNIIDFYVNYLPPLYDSLDENGKKVLSHFLAHSADIADIESAINDEALAAISSMDVRRRKEAAGRVYEGLFYLKGEIGRKMEEGLKPTVNS
jgi:hypothetical protein